MPKVHTIMTDTRPPLPEPFSRFRHEPGMALYTADQMTAYVDTCNQALRERVRVLEVALSAAIRQNSHDMLMTGEEIRNACAALKGTP